VLLILVGNKVDIADRKISTDEAYAFANSRNMMYFETSAKIGLGVDNMFKIISDIM
jgi:GTPase SAR1 family protein